MEFIKNIFEKIKNFFTIHERVRMLEVKANRLEAINSNLARRIMLLEFKNDANGAKYLFNKIKPLSCSNVGPFYWAVAFINKDHVVSLITDEKVGPHDPVINGNYIEFYRFGKIDTVYTTEEGGEDKLIPVDIELYKKAYPEKFATYETSWCTVHVDTAEDPLTNRVGLATDDIKNDFRKAVDEGDKVLNDIKKAPKKKTTTKKKTTNKEKTK